MKDKGIALVIILVVIMVLMIIAIPFVASMLNHESASKGMLNRAHALLALEGAKNYAIAQLYLTNDCYERRSQRAPVNTPYCDGLREFRIDLRDKRLTDQLNATDPADIIWGVQVFDEQGKIDLRSAPRWLTNNIMRLRAPAGTGTISTNDNVKDYVTQFACRDAEWAFPQKIRVVTSRGFIVDSRAYLGVESKLRIISPTGRAMNVTVADFDGAEVVTNPTTPAEYEGGIAEVEYRYPVNINTASLEVLQALFTGLYAGDETYAVTEQEARYAAKLIHDHTFGGGLFNNYGDVVLFLTKRLNRNDRDRQIRGFILANALNPARIGGGTLPFAFKSYDTVTIKTSASVNAPTGVEMTARYLRDVTEVTPPGIVTASVETQYDFDYYSGSGRGYPFGNKIYTMPNFPSDILSTDNALLPDVTGKPNGAYVACRPAEDNRGNAQIFMRRDHFPNDHEGMELKGGQLNKSWQEVFSPAGADITAGGMEMWIRFDSAPQDGAYLFDIREGDYTNRLSLQYTGGELVFNAADATLEQWLSQIRVPFSPVTKRWYHIGAYWKGTKFGHLALFIDGFSHPAATFRHINPAGQNVVTTLAAPLPVRDGQGNTVTSLRLSDDGALPAFGAIEIGGEVIEYANKDWNSVLRAARGSSIQNHPAGAKVTIYGYSNRLASTSFTLAGVDLSVPSLKPGRGRLGQAFGANTTASVYKLNPDGTPGQISATDTDIPVTANAIGDFPQAGYIRIDNEVVRYTSVQTGRPVGQTPAIHQFKGCQRGQLGTTAAVHVHNAAVSLYGFSVTDNSDYLSPCLVQIGDEWIGPLQKLGNDYFTGVIDNGAPRQLLRGYLSTTAAHIAGEEIIPVFRVNSANCEMGDRVTLIDARNRKESHLLRRVGGTLAAFNEFIGVEYAVDNVHTRLLKFPSGELLSLSWLQQADPAFAVGGRSGIRATIDELKFYASPEGNFRALNTLDAGSGGGTLLLNSAGGISATGGAVKVGDEIIGYPYGVVETINQRQFLRLNSVRRGYLNSPTHVHDRNDLAFNLSFLPISALSAPLSRDASSIQVRGGMAAGAEGYLYIGDGMGGEVAGYTSYGGTSFSMVRAKDGSGLFRGMFGTSASEHGAETMVYAIPFRVWDTYKPREFDNKMVYWQASFGIPHALWRRARWEEEIPGGEDHVNAKILLRIGGRGEWIDALSPRGPLYEFPGGAGGCNLNRRGDSLDVRIYFAYEPGAFYPADGWKQSPRIKGVWADYERETRSLFHEEE